MPASLIILFNATQLPSSKNEEIISLLRFALQFFWLNWTTNRLIQDKKVEIKWNEPYLILSKYNVLGDKLETKNKKEADSKKEGLPKGWAHLGSNQGPSDYESDALTSWAIGPGFRKNVSFIWNGLQFYTFIVNWTKKYS